MKTIITERITLLFEELETMDATLSRLPDNERGDAWADRLVQRIEEIQDELELTYAKHNPMRYKAWKRQKNKSGGANEI
jgi:hypothetical protein